MGKTEESEKQEKSMSKWIQETLEQMTLEEKIGQMCQVALTKENASEVYPLIREGKVGSCILTGSAMAGNVDEGFDSNIAQEAKKAARESRLGIPLLLGRDVIHGSRTIFPIPLALAASFDPDLGRECAGRMVREAAKEGVNWTFAPMLDIVRDPRWGRVIEGFGEDPYLAGAFGAAFVEGIQEQNVVACAKHFIGYGAAEGGRDYNKAELTDYTLRNTYLEPFRKAVQSGVATVMNNFGQIGGTPCVANPYLFRTLLKKELGFEGFVISDWGSIEWQLKDKTAKDKAECAKNALEAGIDMEMVTDCYRSHLKGLLEKGEVSAEWIDEAVGRILSIKEKFGRTPVPEGGIYEREDLKLARKAALECMVLLKNRNRTLPVEKGKKVLVAGPFAREKRNLYGSWCGGGIFEKEPSFYEALKEELGEENVCMDEGLYSLSAPVLGQADSVVLALGEAAGLTGERNSMANPVLDPMQVLLAKRAFALGKKVIAVIFAGRPLLLSDLEPYTEAILYAWHTGAGASRAACALLSGKEVPQGKCPMSFLRSTGQIPLYYNAQPLPVRVEGENHYYGNGVVAAYDDEQATPLYPFGFGLHYTELVYRNLTLSRTDITLKELEAGEKVSLSVEITNVGKERAVEVCQLYVGDEVARKVRPVKELKGIFRVELNPGETKTVSFAIGYEQLGYYPQQSFTAEPGEFRLYAGSSCMTEEYTVLEVV